MNSVKGAFFVSGPAGAGKSTLAKQLTGRGYHAIDGDIGLGALGNDGLGAFFDENGRPTSHLHPESQEWKDRHTWKIVGETLKRVISDHKEDHIFICMAAHNQYDFFYLFDKIFFLDLSPEALQRRLLNKRDHGYGQEPFQQKRILDDFPNFRLRMQQEGAIFINAEQSDSEAASQIIEEASKTSHDH